MIVSAIIPTCNSAHFIASAIESCLAIEAITEVIVIDDGSTDNTQKLLAKIKDQRVIAISHPHNQNLGRSASRNLGIASANNDWIIFCDADDYILPSRLEHLIGRNHDGIDGYYDSISAKQDPEAPIAIPDLNTTGIRPGIDPEELLEYLVSHREERISILGLTIRKKCLKQINSFDTQLEIGEDTDLLWRLAHTSDIHHSGKSDSVATRRIHKGNTYQDKTQVIKGRYNFYKKWKQYGPSIGLSETALDRINSSHAYYKRQYIQTKGLQLLQKWLPLKKTI